MMVVGILFLVLFIFILSWFITGKLIVILRKQGVMDVPNARSSHITPTPRGGGLAILISATIGFLAMGWLFPEMPLPGPYFFIGLALLAITSLADDKFDLPAYVRFLLHAIAATLVIAETGGLQQFPLPPPLDFDLGYAGYFISFIWIMSVVNIYNFLDGIDGYAGSQAVLAGAGMALFDPQGAALGVGLMVAAASAGFLIHNWKPAKIFMGDIGSVALGFIFASAPFYFAGLPASGGVYAMIILLWFFLADGAFTIIRRLINREKIWEAHRSHVYQQWVIAGMPHEKVVATVMLGSFILTVAFICIYNFWPSYLLISLGLALLFFVMYFWLVQKAKRTGN